MILVYILLLYNNKTKKNKFLFKNIDNNFKPSYTVIEIYDMCAGEQGSLHAVFGNFSMTCSRMKRGRFTMGLYAPATRPSLASLSAGNTRETRDGNENLNAVMFSS